MEEIGGFVPVLVSHVSLSLRGGKYDPHRLEIIGQKVKKGITGEETKTKS